jgi:hypothetical protein
MTEPLKSALSVLAFARQMSNMLLADFPAEKAAYQPSPTDNHVLWALGHLALTDKWVAGVLDIPGVDVPEAYFSLFGAGSAPVGDAKAYPALADMKRVFESSRAALLKWYQSAPAEALKKDLSEKSHGFTTDPIDCLFKLAWHEGWHFGQVANVRKALGLPNKLG